MRNVNFLSLAILFTLFSSGVRADVGNPEVNSFNSKFEDSKACVDELIGEFVDLKLLIEKETIKRAEKELVFEGEDRNLAKNQENKAFISGYSHGITSSIRKTLIEFCNKMNE